MLQSINFGSGWDIAMKIEQAALQLDYVFMELKALLSGGLVIGNQSLILLDLFL